MCLLVCVFVSPKKSDTKQNKKKQKRTYAIYNGIDTICMIIFCLALSSVMSIKLVLSFKLNQKSYVDNFGLRSNKKNKNTFFFVWVACFLFGKVNFANMVAFCLLLKNKTHTQRELFNK